MLLSTNRASAGVAEGFLQGKRPPKKAAADELLRSTLAEFLHYSPSKAVSHYLIIFASQVQRYFKRGSSAWICLANILVRCKHKPHETQRSSFNTRPEPHPVIRLVLNYELCLLQLQAELVSLLSGLSYAHTLAHVCFINLHGRNVQRRIKITEREKTQPVRWWGQY